MLEADAKELRLLLGERYSSHFVVLGFSELDVKVNAIVETLERCW